MIQPPYTVPFSLRNTFQFFFHPLVIFSLLVVLFIARTRLQSHPSDAGAYTFCYMIFVAVTIVWVTNAVLPTLITNVTFNESDVVTKNTFLNYFPSFLTDFIAPCFNKNVPYKSITTTTLSQNLVQKLLGIYRVELKLVDSEKPQSLHLRTTNRIGYGVIQTGYILRKNSIMLSVNNGTDAQSIVQFVESKKSINR